MALQVKHAVFYNSGFNASASSGILQGMVVASAANATTGVIELARANRDGTHAAASIMGLAGDDATNSGNTIAQVDPVYQTYYMRPARRLGDFLDETITNRTNWTDSGTARRGITVYSVGGEFATDMYVSTASANGATTDAGAAPTLAINDGWTYASGSTNAGKLIDDGAQSVSIIARLIASSATNSLLPFRLFVTAA